MVTPTEQEHAHRFDVDPAVRTPKGEYEGRCACGAVKAYPLTPVVPGKAASVARSASGTGVVFRVAFGAESGRKGAAATNDINRRQQRYRPRERRSTHDDETTGRNRVYR